MKSEETELPEMPEPIKDEIIEEEAEIEEILSAEEQEYDTAMHQDNPKEEEDAS